MAQCSVEYELAPHNGKELGWEKKRVNCTREALYKGYCIFHSNEPDKDRKLFRQELDRILSQNDPITQNLAVLDFSHFVFPELNIQDATLVLHACFSGATFLEKVNFSKITFRSHAQFDECIFMDDVVFEHSYDPKFQSSRTTFWQTVSFKNTCFHKKADFNHVVFRQPVEFKGTKFEDGADFTGVHFPTARKESPLLFDTVTLGGETTFGEIPWPEGAVIALRNCDLSGLLFTSLPFRSQKVILEGIHNWDLSGKIRMLHDERQKGINAVKLLDAYRFLEKDSYDKSDFELAKDFSIGRMRAKRRDESYGKLARALNWCYELFANYGHSIVRPSVLLLLMWLLLPVLFLFTGFKVSNSLNKEKPCSVNYDWGQEKGSSAEIVRDYFSVFVSNIALSTIDRKNELSPPSDSWQKIVLLVETALNVILLGFVIIAVRRKFTERKPLDT